ncbi:MAG: hypothetical protein ACLF0G_01950 [Candidatus Brocadiia bacterium]
MTEQSQPPTQPSGLEDYLGEQVVVDTRSSYVLLGTLVGIHRDYLTLETVDVHDTGFAESTKDQYIMEAGRLGICANRNGAKVRIAEVVSVSLLRDVITI